MEQTHHRGMTVFRSSLNVLLHNAAKHVVEVLAESERNIALSERLGAGFKAPGHLKVPVSPHRVTDDFMYPSLRPRTEKRTESGRSLFSQGEFARSLQSTQMRLLR